MSGSPQRVFGCVTALAVRDAGFDDGFGGTPWPKRIAGASATMAVTAASGYFEGSEFSICDLFQLTARLLPPYVSYHGEQPLFRRRPTTPPRTRLHSAHQVQREQHRCERVPNRNCIARLHRT